MKISKVLHIVLTAFVLPLIFVMSAQAHHASPKDAQELARQASDYYDKVGRLKAFNAFSSQKEPFKKGELYVFAFDLDGVCLAHGDNEALIGRNMFYARDALGEPFIENIVSVETSGWVEYMWRSPVTGQVAPKKSYIIRKDDIVIGVGSYLNEE